MKKIFTIILGILIGFSTCSTVYGQETWYTLNSGDWSSQEIWTLDPAAAIKVNPEGKIPGEFDNVIIKPGNTISMDGNNYQANVLTVDGRLELKETNGHRFSQIRGSGRILMEADNFPSGDATHFTSKNMGEGTVVFQGNSFAIGAAYTFFNVDVEMDAGKSVTLSSDLKVNGSLTIRSGEFRINNNSSAVSLSVDVDEDVAIQQNALFSVGKGKAVHHLNVNGSFYNEGTVTFSNSGQYSAAGQGAVVLHFGGASDEELVANGPTNLYRLFVEKGTDRTFLLEVRSNNSNNFNLYGPISGNSGVLTSDGSAGWERLPLVLRGGTLRLGNNIDIPRLGANRAGTSPNEFHIPAKAALWIDGASVMTHENGGAWRAITIYGKLKVSAGSFSTPNGSGGINYFSNEDNPGTLEINGGTVSITQLKQGDGSGQFNYIQTGGDLLINGLSDSRVNSGVFALPRASHTFTMTGGKISISAVNDVENNGIEIGVAEGNYQVSGGTIEVVTPTLNYGSQGNEFRINSTAPFYNFGIVHANGATGNQSVVLDNNFRVLNDFTIGNESVFSDNGYEVAVGRNLNVTGSYSQKGVLVFNGSQNGQILNSTGANLTLNDLTINKDRHPSDGNYFKVSFAGNQNININGDLNLLRGAFDVGNYWPTITGDVIVSDGDLTSSGSGGLELTGSSPVLKGKSGKEFNFGDIRLNNDNNGLSLATDVNVESFAFSSSGSGKVNIGVYNFTVTGSIFNYNNNRFFYTAGLPSNGGLTLPVNAGSNGSGIQFFPVGSGPDRYTPMQVDANESVSTNGTITMRPVNDYHPTVTDQTYALNYYWKVEQSGLDGDEEHIRYQFTHYETINVPVLYDLFTADYPEGMVFNSNKWTGHGNGVKVGNNNLRLPFSSQLSDDYTFGVIAGGWLLNYTPEPRTLYSRNATNGGDFDNRNTWSDTGHNGRRVGNQELPTNIDFCVIASGHTVRINANNASASQILIEEGGLLIVEDGTNINSHDIQIIKGGGTLVYEENNNGATYSILNTDHSEFLNNKDATVEFSGTGNPRVMPSNSELACYPNLKISGSGEVRSQQDEDVLVNEDLIVESGTLNFLATGGTTVTIGRDVNVNSGTTIFANNNNRNRFFEIGGDLNFNGVGKLTDSGVEGNDFYIRGDINQNHGNIALNYTKVVFEGVESASYSNTGGSANFNRIEIRKPSTESVSFNSPFSLNGSTTGADKALKLTSGECHLNHSGITINLTTGGHDFEIPSDASLIVDEGATVRASGDNTGIWLDGLLKIDNGAQVLLNGGSNNYVEYTASGNAEIWVGNTNNTSPVTQLNVGAQIRRATNTDAGVLKFNQDKAATSIVIGSKEPTIGNRGVFEILNKGSVFNQNEDGSLVTIANGQTNASVPALIFSPDTNNSSSGSGFVIGDNTTADGANIGLLLTKPLNYLRVALPANATAQLQTVAGNVKEHLDIESGSFNANGLDLSLFGDITNTGTFESFYNTTYFKGEQNQSIKGDVTFHKVVKEGGSVLLQAEDSEVSINNDLDIVSGVMNTADNQLIVKGNLLIEEGASTVSSSATDGIVMEGSNSQLLQVEGEIACLSVNNAAGVAVPTQGGAIHFSKQLKLEDGVLDIGRNLLVIGKNAKIVSGTSGFSEDAMIQTNLSFTDAGVQKFFPQISSSTEYTIPIGSMGKYTPVVLNVTNNGNATGSIRVKAANEPHITIDAGKWNRVLQYNWTLDAEGIEDFSANVTMQTFADAVEGDGASYITARLLDESEGLWNKYSVDDFDENNYVLNFIFSGTNDAGIDGDFTAGEADAIPYKVQTFTTRNDGAWTDISTWRVEGSGSVPSGGPRGAIVKINHEVTVPENSFTAASYMTEIGNAGILDLGNTFGHRLGKVKGTGLIEMERNAVPAGQYDEFLAEGGGTLEFSGSSDYDVLGQITNANNLVLSGTGQRRLGSANLILNGSLTIEGVDMVNESEVDLSLKGNLTLNNGVFDFRNGLLMFNGSKPQGVGGLSAFTGENAINRAILSNSTGISLSKELEIKESFVVQDGNVGSSNASPLVISSSDLDALKFNNPNSFIGTTLRKALNVGDSYDFRVGENDRPGILNLGSVNVSGFWEVAYFNSNPGEANFDPDSFVSPIEFVSRNEYWRVKGPNGSGARVTVRWDSQSGISADAAEREDLRLVSWQDFSSDAWEEVGSNIADNGQNSGSIQSDALLSFNEFADGNYFTLGGVQVYSYPWIGFSEDWLDSKNWDSGNVPSINTEVEIPENPSGGNQPVINGDAFCKDLSLAVNSRLTLQAGSTLEIANDVDNAGTIVLESTNTNLSSLMLPKTMTNSGNVNVKLTLDPDHYWYLSSPLQNAVAGWFKPSEDVSKDYVYVFEVDNNHWQWIRLDQDDVDANRPLAPLQGVAAYYYTNSKKLDFTGKVNNSDVTIIPDDPGYHLVGNPYPTAIDWENPAGWTRAGFSNTIWSWINSGGERIIQTYNNNGKDLPGVWTLEPDGYNAATMSHIPPYQSVWMKQESETAVPLTVKREARVKNSDAPLKSVSSGESSFEIIRVKAQNMHTMDATVIYFNGSFSAGKSREDSEKRFNSSEKVPEVYTRINNQALAINGQPILSAEKNAYALSVRNRIEGEVSLVFDLTEFTNETYDVLLEDKETGSWTDIKDVNEYTYTPAQMGDDHDRFVLHLDRVKEVPTSVEKAEDSNSGDITIISKDEYALVTISQDLLISSNAKIEVLDMNGRLVIDKNTSEYETELVLPDSSGMYIVKVRAGNQIKTKKIVSK